MSIAVPIETAKRNLESLLERLRPGETITLLDPEGTPMAIVVSLMSTPVAEARRVSDWEKEWAALAEEIGHAWKGEKSAVEALSEMRR